MKKTTTIQISTELAQELKNRKFYEKETYEDIIWDLVETNMELTEETKKHIEEAMKEIKEGKTIPLEEVEKRLGLK